MVLQGVDVYIWQAQIPDVPKSHGKFTLKLISNRGTRVYPPPAPEMDLIDWHRCRFVSDQALSDQDVDQLVSDLTGLGFRWTKTQKLFTQDGVALYSEPY
jgi:hypothetical protein